MMINRLSATVTLILQSKRSRPSGRFHVSEQDELNEARRVLAFVFHRSKFGLFSFKRSQRDKALCDVNYWTEKYSSFWKPALPPSRNRVWFGESP